MLHSEELSAKARAFPGLNLKSIEGTVLSTIINAKVEDLDEIEVKATTERSAKKVSLYEALSPKKQRNFILECKKSSPTLGDFCKDFNLDKLICCYEQRAAAISVLCEKHFFKGSLEYLRYVKSRTRLPVICKDFIISEAQLEQAYAAGADAVLLMLSVLNRGRFMELYRKARDLGLEVLSEVDSKDDALFAAENRLPIVGINNRDLRVLSIDLNRAKDLAALFTDEKIRVVSESGINTHRDLVFLNPIRNFLIGSAITAQQNVEFKANSMLYGLNKLCGITSKDALAAAVANHVALCGLIFAQKSPRCLDVDTACNFTREFKGKTAFVGVFVNERPENMAEIAKKVGLDFIQLHGSESPAILEELKKLLPGIKLIKAIAVNGQDSFGLIEDYAKLADLILLDSKAPGSGNSFNWRDLPDFIDKSKTLLSGGVGLDNLKEALSLGFAGLDLNSKLEDTTAHKDVNLINRAFDIINNY